MHNGTLKNFVLEILFREMVNFYFGFYIKVLKGFLSKETIEKLREFIHMMVTTGKYQIKLLRVPSLLRIGHVPFIKIASYLKLRSKSLKISYLVRAPFILSNRF